MTEIEDELSKIKNDMYGALNNNIDNKDLLKHLYKFSNKDEELQEIIILLYSNFKSEMDLVNTHQFTSVNKLIDINIKLVSRLKHILAEKYKVKENKPKGILAKLMELPNVLKGLILVMTGIVTLVVLHEVFPESTEMIIKFIGNLFTSKPITKL